MIGGVIFEGTKLRRVHGALLAFAGSGARFNQIVAWYSDGALPSHYPPRDKDDDSVLVCITQDADGVHIQRFESTGYPLVLDGGYYANGIGRDAALAALYCGKSAQEAISIAALVLSSCGNGVDTLTFDPQAPLVGMDVARILRGTHAEKFPEPEHP